MLGGDGAHLRVGYCHRIGRRPLAALAGALVLATPLLSRVACSQVPVLGRWQEFSYTAEAVESQAALEYQDSLATLRTQGQLDDDVPLTARVRRIAAGLIEQAIAVKPSAAEWTWEIHMSSSKDQQASTMAGGKLLLGSEFISRLKLTDGELATLIGHEIAHAIAEHQREELSQVSYLNSTKLPITVRTAMARLDSSWSLQIRLSKLSRMQESEADQLGMTLARRAGWPAASMVSFYRKLSKNGDDPGLSRSYPSAASRLKMAETLARLYEKEPLTSETSRR